MANDSAPSASMSHNQAMEIFKNGVTEMTKDCLLSSIPNDVTVDEINSLIALEYGLAMTVSVRKDNGEIVAVIVPQDFTVRQFRKAFQRQTLLQLKRKGDFRRISWKYVWKSYKLTFEGIKLDSDDTKLIEYGIRNGTILTFVKTLRPKRKVKRR